MIRLGCHRFTATINQYLQLKNQNIMNLKKLTVKESVEEYQIGIKKKTGGNKLEKTVIISSSDASIIAKRLYGEDMYLYETFWIIALNRANNPKAYFKIGQGGIGFCPVDVILIAKCAIDCLASSIILVHNHPSGAAKPSDADKGLTEKIKKALDLFDIKVLDHLIVTPEKYFSFADDGIL